MIEEKDYILRLIKDLIAATTKILQINHTSTDDINIVIEKYFGLKDEDIHSTNNIDTEKIKSKYEDQSFVAATQLAELLWRSVANEKDSVQKKNIAEKSLSLFEFVQRDSKTYSLQIETKIKEIREFISRIQ